MPTDCSATQLDFEGFEGRQVVGSFDGGAVTSNAGAVALREVDRVIGLTKMVAHCVRDRRNREYVVHQVETLLAQRIHGQVLGYEDLNDHDELRLDPLLAAVVGKRDPKGARRRARNQGAGLAGSRTLNRLELGTPDAAQSDRYKRISLDTELVDELLVDVFLASYSAPPKEIVLDLDATDAPLHGAQEGRFFHGYYDCYCYLPLYIFCGEHLLCARLRRDRSSHARNQDGPRTAAPRPARSRRSTIRRGPRRCSSGERARNKEVASAPTAGAERNTPSSPGPACRMSRANTGSSAVRISFMTIRRAPGRLPQHRLPPIAGDAVPGRRSGSLPWCHAGGAVADGL